MAYYNQDRFWLRYYQDGGALTNDSVDPNVLQEIVVRALSGDQEASTAITQIAEAAQNGDQQAASLMGMIQEIAAQLQQSTQTEAAMARFGGVVNYLNSLKCGGSIRGTKKRARRAPKRAKGGCIPCQKKMLRKQGGLLIEVCAD